MIKNLRVYWFEQGYRPFSISTFNILPRRAWEYYSWHTTCKCQRFL